MKSRKLRVIVSTVLILCMCVVFTPTYKVEASAKLPSNQQEMADEIARIAIDNYDKYGVLPSVAVVQAFIESTLGEHPSNVHNYYGIKSGAVAYGSVTEGIIAYLKIINNGCYTGAPFCKSYKTTMSRILAGGYCEPVGDYYENAIWSIEHYGFYKYDQQLFKIQKKKARQAAREKKRLEKLKELRKRQKHWSKTYTLKYDPSIKGNYITVDKSKIASGCIQATNADCSIILIRDVKPGRTGYEIGVPEQEWDGIEVKIQVFENAKG